MILLMRSVKSHYGSRGSAKPIGTPIHTARLGEPIIVIPVEHWSVVSEKAVRFAWRLSHEIHVVHVECGEDTDSLCRTFPRLVEAPAKAAGLPVPELVVLKSPFRFIVRPILNYALELEEANPDKTVAVLIPELVESRWYYFLLITTGRRC